MATWISTLDGRGTGPRVAVKDIIDVAGSVTTAGCPAVANRAVPATSDAACLAGARAADARLVGKANLHELAFGGTGVNRWYGTPVNPVDPSRVPGGSSSGSAVAVATGEADIGFGSDTGGSVRTPAACCGIVGLKTTHGRIPVDGVWPLAPSADTIGPLGATVAMTAAGMALLEPGFAVAGAPAAVLGRVRLEGTDPAIDAAIDAALRAAEVEVIEIELAGWPAAETAAVTIVFAEALATDGALIDAAPDRVGADIRDRMATAGRITAEQLAAARARRDPWRAELATAFTRAPVLALPTLRMAPPLLDQPAPNTRYANAPVNLAGHPALALPVPTGGHLPASLQLLGPDGSEDLLLATGALVEAAVG